MKRAIKTSRELGRIARRCEARGRGASALERLMVGQYVDCELLRANVVAELLKIHRDTLYNWRREKVGPPAIRIGVRVRYPRAGLVDWLERQEKIV
jgi:predicted DNA-binding transcriptional regulator AlpA